MGEKTEAHKKHKRKKQDVDQELDISSKRNQMLLQISSTNSMFITQLEDGDTKPIKNPALNQSSKNKTKKEKDLNALQSNKKTQTRPVIVTELPSTWEKEEEDLKSYKLQKNEGERISKSQYSKEKSPPTSNYPDENENRKQNEKSRRRSPPVCNCTEARKYKENRQREESRHRRERSPSICRCSEGNYYRKEEYTQDPDSFIRHEKKRDEITQYEKDRSPPISNRRNGNNHSSKMKAPPPTPDYQDSYVYQSKKRNDSSNRKEKSPPIPNYHDSYTISDKKRNGGHRKETSPPISHHPDIRQDKRRSDGAYVKENSPIHNSYHPDGSIHQEKRRNNGHRKEKSPPTSYQPESYIHYEKRRNGTQHKEYSPSQHHQDSYIDEETSPRYRDKSTYVTDRSRRQNEENEQGDQEIEPKPRVNSKRSGNIKFMLVSVRSRELSISSMDIEPSVYKWKDEKVP